MAIQVGEPPQSNRYLRALQNDEMDCKFGFERYRDKTEKLAFLLNMHAADVMDEDQRLVSAVDYFFIQEDGARFKVTMPYQPYFYIRTKTGTEKDVSTYLSRKLSGRLAGIDIIEKEDLDLPNHLIGLRAKFLKLRFFSVEDLMKAKRDIMPAVRKNQKSINPTYDESLFSHNLSVSEEVTRGALRITDQRENIIDIREYDVPYHVRVSIDLQIFCGLWYFIRGNGSDPPKIRFHDDPTRPEPIILAFDIETTKLPLKFPDSATDSIMMISYMIDAQGYLITNREIISKDVEDFEFTPRPEYPGPFIVFNEPDEQSLLERFIQHFKDVRPNIIVTYNGDAFDWPFVDARMAHFGISLAEEIGFTLDSQNEYKSRHAIHMDAYRWVKRDSYLPVGSQHLKAATRAKLRYNPVEVDPEDMCRMASEDPQGLSNYSVSDAVATYYLYLKYVHPFIFALSTIIPLEPDEVLRKGSGTLCEALLMVKAYEANVIFPNKQESVLNKLTNDGHMLDTETYVGGHVEAIESGVFRADIPSRFKVVPAACQKLIDGIEEAMQHAIVKEEGVPLETVLNFDEVCEQIRSKLVDLRDNPNRYENPLIYHLDVGAMYPNIILTNRLQPSAIVDEATCAACSFNRPSSRCQRDMEWMWRGDYMPASRSEIHNIRQQLETELISIAPGEEARPFHNLSKEEQAQFEKKRLQQYCRKAYKKTRVTREEERITTVCMRENSFYVDTVRAFRDRRYEFKGLLKMWKRKLDQAKKSDDPTEERKCNGMVILYDSLQLAHKCILNSFYGYVMRKGARWYSMEMAGIVCYTGAKIITKAREIVEQIGRPLELDTDGIWCILPSSFPENVTVLTNDKTKTKLNISYPGSMLNIMVQEHFTNDQYQTLEDREELVYSTRIENSIFFEVDGPYLAMVLPAAKEEGKKLKKRYAVFNFDGSLAELKGFEVKRRGELQVVKIFQSEVFDKFLKGHTLEECFAEVAKVADYWLDILYKKAENMGDEELFELIAENRSMSRKLEDYGEQKSTSISTAKRLAEFLGDQMVKDKGLACRFVIVKKPEGAPVTERAIPLAIFHSEASVKKHYLRKWLKDNSLVDFDIRPLLDWEYYIERLSSTIQKIITIPATLQGINNPVPRVHHPEWLHKRLLEKNDIFKQKRISDLFSHVTKGQHLEALEEAQTIDNASRKRKAAEMETGIGSVSRRNKLGKYMQKNDSHQTTQLNWRTVLGNPPSIGTSRGEMEEWVSFHKKKWLIQRKNLKLAKRQSIVQPPDRQGSNNMLIRSDSETNAGNLAGFLRKQATSLGEDNWEIIEVCDSLTPGRFSLWVLLGRDLHSIKLQIPRIFYINCKSPEDFELQGSICRKVNKHLPRSCPSKYLYEFRIPEEQFIDQISSWTMQLSGPNVEGIYETQVPLMFRIIKEFGCVCSVNKDFRGSVARGEVDVFEIQHLSSKQDAEPNYLRKEMRVIYLYQSGKENRSIFGLFITGTKKCHTFLVDTIRKNRLSNLTSLYENEWRSFHETGQVNPLPPEDYAFESRVDTEYKHTFRYIDKLLAEYKREKRGPTIVLLQTSLSRYQLSKSVPSLRDFPSVQLAFSDSDSRYPALDWQRVAAKSMISSFLVSLHSFELQKQLSRYGGVPVGNISQDVFGFLIDIYFSRNLTRHNHLLWVSRSPNPDLGGKQQTDFRFLSNPNEVNQVEINNPGTYATVCIEFAVHSLALVSILQSSHINDYEGGTVSSISFDFIPQASLEEMLESGVSSTNILSAFDEAALCSSTFKILRSMVWGWVKDIHQGNEMADILQQHFYRWLKSPSSLLYEPGLCRMIHKLMKKIFIQFIAEFRRMGANIVYASFNKLVICTRKKKIEDALSYSEFILSSIHNKDLFHYVGLEQVQCWEYLLWMDTANFGGVLVETCQSEVISEERKLDMRWNVREHLASEPDYQLMFSRLIEEHITDVYTHAHEEYNITKEGETPILRKTSTQQPSAMGMSVLNFTIQRVEDVISQQMYKIVYDVKQNPNYSESQGKADLLNFVKTACKIFSLDTNLETQVTKIKRDLLKLLNVGEFSQSAVFKNPCCSFVLPQIICHYCDYARDLDVVRDANNEYEERRSWIIWKCTCGQPYDRDFIESELVEIVQNLSRSYLLQDLVCLKCNQVKADHMSLFCPCAGEYSKTLSNDKLAVHYDVFQNIATAAGLTYLSEVVSWIKNKPINSISLNNSCK